MGVVESLISSSYRSTIKRRRIG